VAVPVAALVVWLIVIKGSYRTVEKAFLVACLLYVAYPISGFLARPDWAEVGRAMILPSWTPTAASVAMLIAITGTTIAPWMQFYQQAAVVDKGLTAKDYRWTRLDVLVGCIAALVVVFFIVVTCGATIFKSGYHVESVMDAAEALRPLAGKYCAGLFALGLLNASLFAACILPLATTYQLAEGMGWERGLDRSFAEAPEFYTIYTGTIVLGAGLVLLPRAPLLQIMYLSQVLNGLLLPAVLVFMLLLINNSGLMGKYTNSRLYNYLAWTCVALVSALGLYLAFTTFFPGAGAG
jgi:Mn2+/Fe2+ NRAMP family transporter